jgi:hypothetical protein
MPEFIAIKRWVVVSHIAGLSNVFADMASRPEKRHLMFKLAAVMKVELTKVEPPVDWLEMIIEELLSVSARGEASGVQGAVRSPTLIPPPGQHADSPHFAALGEEEGNSFNKASFLAQRVGGCLKMPCQRCEVIIKKDPERPFCSLCVK